MAEPQSSVFASGRFEAKTNHRSYTATELSLLRHREKVAAHAERKLPTAKTDSISPKELRAFVRLEDERLRVADRMGAGGIWTARARSFTLDLVVRRAFEAAAKVHGSSPANPNSAVAVIALGGYGRAELAPFSDLDLLFLTSEQAQSDTANIVDRCQHLLWDAGLRLGQKSCSPGQAITISRTDPHFQTALVDARLVTGEAALYEQLVRALDREREKNARLLIDTVRHERDLRYQTRGAVVYLQEPNVKEGAGGLRDLHSALWAAYAQSGLNTLEKLLAHGRIEPDACQRAIKSYDFLLRVRGHMHWITGRKTDHLALDLQEVVARKLGYSSSGQWQASEKFMREYYRHAREVHQISESLFSQSRARIEAARRWFAPIRRKRLDGLFSLQDRQLHFDSDAAKLSQNPALQFRAAALAQTNAAIFSHELAHAISHSLGSLDNEFRASKEAARLFLALLRKPAEVGRTLRMMHEVGLLGRYLPEFERVSMLIQHDLYHQFTVDEHTLKAIEALDDLHRRSDRNVARFRAVLDQVHDVGLLYLALLLHDLGKAGGRGHIPRGTRIAERICTRLGLDHGSRSKVVLLVKQHVAMAQLSQRRDLREPRLAKQFARQVGDLDVLNMLFLLTYADLNGVGPTVWSDWKGDLLGELYTRTRAVLTGETNVPAVRQKRDRLKKRVIESLRDRIPISEIERHFALSQSRYTEAITPEDVELHLELVRELETVPFACRWRDREDFATELTICARDRHGLFADIAGALAATGIEILTVDVNTREDGIALDRFILQQATTRRSIDEHRWGTIERALRAAVDSEHDVAALVERWRTRHAPRPARAGFNTNRVGHLNVICDNEVAESTTVVEVRAPDGHGLAYQIASALTHFGLDIVCARVATEKSDALDVFYVTRMDGSKLDEGAMRELEEVLTEGLANAGSDLVLSRGRCL